MLKNLERSAAVVALTASVHRSLAETQSSLLAVRLAAYRRIAHLINSHLSSKGLAATQRGIAPCAPAILNAAMTTLAQHTQRVHKHPSETEVTAALSVLQAALLILPSLRRSAVDIGLIPALLASLNTESLSRESRKFEESRGSKERPGYGISSSCLDVLLSIQIKNPRAFLQFSAEGGVQKVAALVKLSSAPESLRAHAARFLNLLMSHIAPEIIEIAHKGTDYNNIPRAVEDAVQNGRAEMAAILGREAAGMIGRRISLDAVSKKGWSDKEKGVLEAEQQLERLASALSLFVQSDP